MAERIAVIGDWNSVLGFRVLGMETHAVNTAEEAERVLRDLAKENCGVICLEERFAKDLGDVIARYRNALQPAVILIPGGEGSLGIGRDQVRYAIKRAIGSDL